MNHKQNTGIHYHFDITNTKNLQLININKAYSFNLKCSFQRKFWSLTRIQFSVVLTILTMHLNQGP